MCALISIHMCKWIYFDYSDAKARKGRTAALTWHVGIGAYADLNVINLHICKQSGRSIRYLCSFKFVLVEILEVNTEI